MAIDPSGNLYVADSANNAIRKVDRFGAVTTIAGLGPQFSGRADGDAGVARFDSPQGVAIDANGNLLVADTLNNAIRRITPGGLVSTLAGGGAGYADGDAGTAMFLVPEGVAVDGQGNVFVADTGNDAIRKIDSQGQVTTVAGRPDSGLGPIDGDAGSARFYRPHGVAVSPTGLLFVADGNAAVRTIDTDGMVRTLAGGVSFGFQDGKGAAASFADVRALALDAYDNVYLADGPNQALRRVDLEGNVVTFAGRNSDAGNDAPGPACDAQFGKLFGVAVASDGPVFFSDRDNQVILGLHGGQHAPCDLASPQCFDPRWQCVEQPTGATCEALSSQSPCASANDCMSLVCAGAPTGTCCSQAGTYCGSNADCCSNNCIPSAPFDMCGN